MVIQYKVRVNQNYVMMKFDGIKIFLQTDADDYTEIAEYFQKYIDCMNNNQTLDFFIGGEDEDNRAWKIELKKGRVCFIFNFGMSDYSCNFEFKKYYEYSDIIPMFKEICNQIKYGDY